jgi:LysR family glycine cleavage system transcriptional activator
MYLNRRWLPLNALRAFEAVGQYLSFTAGAQALHVSQSALSRHVISLERLLGHQLLERRHNGLALTEAGAALLPVVNKAFDRLEQALNAIHDSGHPPHALRVHMPPSLLNQLAMPILKDFRREFPDIMIDVSSSGVTGLPAQDLDVAIVYDQPTSDDRVTDLLWMVRVTPVCSPELWERNKGKTLAEFITSNDLLHVKLEREPRGLLWSSFARQFGASIDPQKGLSFDTAIATTRYAIEGGGIALADIDMFASELESGRLVAPFPEILEDGFGYYLKFHAEDLGDPVISVFRTWMIERFSQPRPRPAPIERSGRLA